MYGTCRFCGQMVETGEVEDTDRVAYQYCDCYGARHEKRIDVQIDQALENIDDLFGESCAERGFIPVKEADVIDLLKNAATQVARLNINRFQMSIPGYGKAQISYGSKGEVKVTRSITKADTMQAAL